MNVGIVIITILTILSCVFWAWYKLKDASEGDLIDMGFGVHVEYSAFQARVVIALFGCFFILLLGLLI